MALLLHSARAGAIAPGSLFGVHLANGVLHSMRMRLSLIAVTALAAAFFFGSRAAKAAPEIAAAPVVTTARIAPPPADGATLALRAELERLINSTGWRGDEWTVTVMSLNRGDTLFAHNADLMLAPASNMKLFTTAAALYYLGDDYRYSTFLLSDGMAANGVLNGNLILYGTGDPTFSGKFGRPSAAFEAFADSLTAQGIREIRGDIIGDGSYFFGSNVGEGWKADYIGASYAAPAGALSYLENLINLRITGSAVGAPPMVVGTPGGAFIGAVVEATTVAKGRTSVNANRMEYDGPLVIRGRIARGASLQRMAPVGDPARYTAAVLREVLVSKGTTVTGSVRSVLSPEESLVSSRSVFAPAFAKGGRPLHVLAVHQSEPVMEVLSWINKISHNMFAEQILRTVGRVAFGDGSAQGGARAVRYMLECEVPGDSSSLKQYDGSGLSPLNRVSSREMIRLLSFMYRSPLYESFAATMNTAGVDRHLRRMYGTPAAGNLKAKTGTIDNVSSLAGYVRSANGEMLAFSIISNSVPSTWKAKRIEDAIGARLASFWRPAGESIAMGMGSDEGPSPEPPIPGVAAPAIQPGTATPEAPAEPDTTVPPGPDTTEQPTPPTPAETKPPVAPAAPAKPAATAAKPKPKPAASATRRTARTHKIRQGDTLTGIAKKYGVSLKALQRANPNVSSKRMQLGKTIRIP
jgi:D-alanyl-D-alanine carboxypeptidase/D-alanyl-D-alanine-endopeptidase (penicillin-binding protein 4)